MGKLTTRQARKLAALRKTRNGGRPRKQTPCPRCHVICDSARQAQAHC